MSEPTITLLSSGEVARRLGIGMTSVHKLLGRGLLPPPIVIEGSGRFVWTSDQWVEIEEAVRTRVDRRRKSEHSKTP